MIKSVMANRSNACPVQVATIETHDNRALAMLDVNAIQKVICRNRIEDLPVVIIAIAGMARTGKSFLLNLMISYLKHITQSPYAAFKTSTSCISGMNWAGGRKAVTNGIWLWEEAFIMNRKDNSEVAILFLDTQGICDGVASACAQVDSQIIYLTLSMATIYIHNVDKEWKLPDRKIYQICRSFSDIYGNGDEEALFNSFTLLYRNWVHDGRLGIRPDVFEDEIKDSKADDEAFKIVNGIDKLFHHKTAWVLPEPAAAVRRGQANISLADVGQEFLDSFIHISNELFSPSGRYSKQIDRAITGRRFVEMMEDLSDRLKFWPDLSTDADQLKDIYVRKAYYSAKEWFEDALTSVENTDNIDQVHARLKTLESNAIERFRNLAKNVKPYDKVYCYYHDKLSKMIERKKELTISVVRRRIMEKELQEAARRRLELELRRLVLERAAALRHLIHILEMRERLQEYERLSYQEDTCTLL